MSEMSNTKRVTFNKNGQKNLLLEFLNNQNWNQVQGAKFFGLSTRSFSDWIREKTTLPYLAYTKIPNKLRKKYPFKKTMTQYWYTKKGAYRGGSTIKQKYGKPLVNEKKRKESWKKWWEKDGKYKHPHIGKSKKIKIPKKTVLLSEFIGTLIGDGGMNLYQTTISLNKNTDKEYSKFIEYTILKLFDIKPSIQFRKDTNLIRLVISSVKLVQFLEKLGIQKGNKLRKGLRIPPWIIKNKNLKKSCLRGIFDTDGCIFFERHKIKNKEYIYPRWNIVSGSIDLIHQIQEILKELGLQGAIRKNGKNYAIQLENKHEICNYFKTVGSSNKKHLDKYSVFKTKEECRRGLTELS